MGLRTIRPALTPRAESSRPAVELTQNEIEQRLDGLVTNSEPSGGQADLSPHKAEEPLLSGRRLTSPVVGKVLYKIFSQTPLSPPVPPEQEAALSPEQKAEQGSEDRMLMPFCAVTSDRDEAPALADAELELDYIRHQQYLDSLRLAAIKSGNGPEQNSRENRVALARSLIENGLRMARLIKRLAKMDPGYAEVLAPMLQNMKEYEVSLKKDARRVYGLQRSKKFRRTSRKNSPSSQH